MCQSECECVCQCECMYEREIRDVYTLRSELHPCLASLTSSNVHQREAKLSIVLGGNGEAAPSLASLGWPGVRLTREGALIRKPFSECHRHRVRSSLRAIVPLGSVGLGLCEDRVINSWDFPARETSETSKLESRIFKSQHASGA